MKKIAYLSILSNFIIGFKEGWGNARKIYSLSGKFKEHSNQIKTELKSGIYSDITQRYVDVFKENKLGLNEWKRFQLRTWSMADAGYAFAGTLFFLQHGKITQMA